MLWFKKRKKEKIISHLPCFLLEVDEDGVISLVSSWAKPENTNELASLIKRVVALLALIGNGKLLPLFQNAISVYGHNHDDEETSKAILITLDKLLRDTNGSQQHETEHKALVPPSEAFRRG